MLSCKDLVENAEPLLVRELTLRQRLPYLLHLLICVHCRRYLRQLRVLLTALPHLRPRASEREVDAVMARIEQKDSSTD